MTKKCQCGKEIEDKYKKCFKCNKAAKPSDVARTSQAVADVIKTDSIKWLNSVNNASNLFAAKMDSTVGHSNFDQMSLVDVSASVIGLARILYVAKPEETK